MTDKKQAIKEVEALIKKYEDLPKTRLKTISEADTRRMFIIPLFRALGWDVDNIQTDNEVVEEETSISGRIDYSFRLNNITQFVVEAKAIPEDLDREKWAYQAIEYGWNKGIPWVVLTDFEGLKVFNSEWKKENPHPNIDLTYKTYVEKFDRLWLLSKESIQKGELDKKASEWGITAKRESVNEHLAKDLLEWRELLTDYFNKWNEKVDPKDIEESVQRILDRLIFMRVVEDRELEEKKLWQAYKKWEENSYEPQNFIESLAPIFRKFDKKYNSNLFVKHLCEDLYTTQEPFKKILPTLYGSKEQGVKYRFDAIDADVLGNVYEQYLGYVQGREGGKSKRKKQGIYYTPTYIVDYIVQNTLGKLLEEKSLREIEKIKVLDPACGSGSFLIKAFDVLNEKIKKERGSKDGVQAALRKYRILTENIYGVDLDPQAVEIARLNLLLKALEPDHKLPMLNENIKNGNSLIDDKKFTDKPFNWREEFPDVSKNGGFDVIIGNPPYIRNRELPLKVKNYFKDEFDTARGQYDIYQLFFEQAVRLLKDGAYLGFITSNKYAIASYGEKLREFLLENCEIVEIIDISNISVFKEASTYPYVIILKKKEKVSSKHQIKIKNVEAPIEINRQNFVNIPQSQFQSNKYKTFSLKSTPRFFGKIEKVSVPLGELTTIRETIHTGNVRSKLIVVKKVDNKTKRLLAGKDCHRYWYRWNNKYIRYDEKLINRNKGEYANLCDPNIFEKPKILLREIAKKIEACLDKDRLYALNKVYSIQVKDKLSYKLDYLLVLLNSNLLSHYFNKKFEETHVRGGYLQFKKIYTSQIPIYKIDFDESSERKKHKNLSRLAQQMISYHKQLEKITGGSDKWNKIQNEIINLDAKIDQEVYKLYGLTSEEIEVVEGNNENN